MVKNDLVWITHVQSRDFITDFFTKVKNIFGGRLKQYEKMVDEAIKGANDNFKRKYPKANIINMQISDLSEGSAIAVTIYGLC